MKRSLAAIVLVLGGLIGAIPAVAQCAMCREAATAQRAEAAEAFNKAIIVLGAPPAIVFASVGWALWRRRDSRHPAAPTTGLQ